MKQYFCDILLLILHTGYSARPLLFEYQANTGHKLLQFDFCSKVCHFATTVVQAASTCETLLNAIFAVSAKHLSLKGEFDPLACDRYQRKCLQILIPALNHERSLPDSTLFAGTAILRLLDEMTGMSPISIKTKIKRENTASSHASFFLPRNPQTFSHVVNAIETIISHD